MLEKIGNALQAIAAALDGPGLLLIAVADSSFLSIPEGNDLLIVILSIGKGWGRMAYYVAMTTIGSIIGCMLLFSVGRKGGNPLLRRRFSPDTVEWAEQLFAKYGALTVVIPSILPPPCPFKIFVLVAGVFRLPVWTFVTAVAVGRSVRYSMWGVLAVLYGARVKTYMQQNLPLVGIFLFAAFLLILAAIVGVYWHRKRAARRAV